MLRLDKYLCGMNVGTRSQVKKELKLGMVSVNGETITRPEYKVDETTAKVAYKGKVLEYHKYVYYMLNKPAGVVSATKDNLHRTVAELLQSAGFGDLFPVGRLDKDTEGLLLMTNDGGLAHALLSPGKHVEKRYEAELEEGLSKEALQKLEQGVEIGEKHPTRPARVELLTEDDGRKEDKTIRENKVLLTLHEGKFHQVKRMLQAVGNEVVGLQRVEFGGLRLDPALEPGEYRELTEEELAILQESCMEV